MRRLLFAALLAALSFAGVRSLRPDGKVANAQVKLGTSTVMVSEAAGGFPAMSASYYLYVENADASMALALARGATLRDASRVETDLRREVRASAAPAGAARW